jgi:Zn-dependent peptidase ImmA (M78 family)
MITIEDCSLDKDFVSSAIALFCDALGIKIPNLLIYMDETIKPNGVCYRNNDTEFMILLKDGRSDAETMITLAHELVHVKQYLVDDLSNKFDDSIPYMERWWEKEAFELEVVLTKLLIETIQKKSCEKTQFLLEDSEKVYK